MLIKGAVAAGVIALLAILLVPVPSPILKIGGKTIKLDKRYFAPERETFASQWLSTLKGWDANGDNAGGALAMLDYETLMRDAGYVGELLPHRREVMVLIRPMKTKHENDNLDAHWSYVKGAYDQCENPEPYQKEILAYRYYSGYGCNTYSILTRPLEEIDDSYEFWAVHIGSCAKGDDCSALFFGVGIKIEIYMPYEHFGLYPKLSELLLSSFQIIED